MPRLDVSKAVPIHTASRLCAFCNASYVPGRSNQRFCSKPCVVDYCHAQSRADPTRKDCLSCRERKPYTEYERGHKLCLKCEAERAGNVKTCRLCKILKPLDGYYRRQWEAKLEAQGGVCAICSRAPPMAGRSSRSVSTTTTGAARARRPAASACATSSAPTATPRSA